VRLQQLNSHDKEWEVVDVKARILPTYFVPDESGSMSQVVGELNLGLKSLLDAIQEETLAAAMVRFAIIGFSDGVMEHLRLADLRDVDSMPVLGSYGGTSYSAVFEDLYQRISTDVAVLRGEGYVVARPAIFFLTDGMPNEDGRWQQALATLRSHDFKFHPNIVAFGIGSAVPSIILQVATSQEYAFVTSAGSDTGAALIKFYKALSQSLVESGLSMARGRSELICAKPEGFKLVIDDLPE